MHRQLELQDILVYYDGPELFLAQDQFEVRYLCLVTERTVQKDVCLCVPVSTARLKELYRGEVDLRSVYERPESPEEYWLEIRDYAHGEYALVPVQAQDVSPVYLPAEGFSLLSLSTGL